MGAVLEADPKFGNLSAGRRGWLSNKVNQRPGLVMQRHPIIGAPEIFAQLRPFKFKELDASFDVTRYGRMPVSHRNGLSMEGQNARPPRVPLWTGSGKA